ncbi:MAG: class I SAM-dependent methyltransferase, partial [Bdellovibrionota bacterium]
MAEKKNSGMSPSRSDICRFVDQIYNNSPLKREKFRWLRQLLPQDLSGKELVDIGGDSGVISYKLRELGGTWTSADLIDTAVESIRSVVGERVFKLEEGKLPLADNSMDYVLIVDMLEHLEDDVGFLRETLRVLRNDGELIVNVPNPKEGALRRFRFWIGQTDEAHGHLRPGYTLEQLETLLSKDFQIIEAKSYSRLFTQLIDTIINAGLSLLKAGKGGAKGKLVTATTFQQSKKNAFLLTVLGPIFSVALFLDALLPCTHGGMLIVKARKI